MNGMSATTSVTSSARPQGPSRAGLPSELQELLAHMPPAARGQTVGFYASLVAQGAIQPGAFNLVDFMYKAGSLANQLPGGLSWAKSACEAAKGLMSPEDLAWTRIGLTAQQGAADAKAYGEELAWRRAQADREFFRSESQRVALHQDQRQVAQRGQAGSDALRLSAELRGLSVQGR